MDIRQCIKQEERTGCNLWQVLVLQAEELLKKDTGSFHSLYIIFLLGFFFNFHMWYHFMKFHLGKLFSNSINFQFQSKYKPLLSSISVPVEGKQCCVFSSPSLLTSCYHPSRLQLNYHTLMNIKGSNESLLLIATG